MAGLLFVASAGACGAVPSSPPSAAPRAASPVAPSTSVSAAPAPATSVDAAWVTADPKLVAVLAAITPVCASHELVFTEQDGTHIHSYSVYAPSLAQDEIDRRFREASKRAGFTPTQHPMFGLSFLDEAKHLLGRTDGALVTVMTSETDGPREAARKLAAATGLDAASSLDSALGSGVTWRSLHFERASGAQSQSAELEVPEPQRGAIEAWAKERHLEAFTDGWLRKLDAAAPDSSGIVVDTSNPRIVSVQQTRSGASESSACRAHPSRAERPAAAPAKQDEPSNDQLLKEMMKE